TVYRRNIAPECLTAFPTPIPHVEGNDLTRCSVHRNPNPLLVGFLLHKAPHFIGFRFQPGHHHGCWPGWELNMHFTFRTLFLGSMMVFRGVLSSETWKAIENHARAWLSTAS